jgi:hypothetical protein
MMSHIFFFLNVLNNINFICGTRIFYYYILPKFYGEAEITPRVVLSLYKWHRLDYIITILSILSKIKKKSLSKLEQYKIILVIMKLNIRAFT